MPNGGMMDDLKAALDMPTLDYQPAPPARRSLARRTAVILATAALAVLVLWAAARLFLPRPQPPAVSFTFAPPGPPVYYQPHDLLALDDFGGAGWRIHKLPTIPGPYRVLDDQLQAQSSVGGPVSGWVGTPQGRLPFDEPEIPDTSLLVVGVANQGAEYGFFVFSRREPSPAATTQPATEE